MPDFTIDQRTEISNAFSAGNYANAYEGTDIEDFDIEEMPAHERAAFVLGFFASYEFSEMSGDERATFDECYWSDAGRAVIAAGYCDDRADEYTEDAEAL